MLCRNEYAGKKVVMYILIVTIEINYDFYIKPLRENLVLLL